MNMYEKNDPDSDDDDICHCPLCAICTVGLIDGEDIITVHHPTGQTTGTTYNACLGSCSHKNGRVAVCHVWCHLVMGAPSRQLSIATCPDFGPERAKIIATRSFVNSLIDTTCIHYRLPKEICQVITPHLVQPWCAAYSALLQASDVSRTVFDLSKRVWANFSKFFGRIYLSGLSNVPSDGPCEYLVYDPRSAAAKGVDVLYVAYDAWGVIRVVYAKASTALAIESQGGIWWRTLPLGHDSKMLVESDGLKIRSVRLQGESQKDHASRVMWAVPQPLKTPLSFYEMAASRGTARYDSCLINGSNTTGYTFHVSSKKLVAHRADDEASNYPPNFQRHKLLTWVYMPIDPDEWITDVWIRTGPTHPNYCLVFRTSKARVQTLGEYYRYSPVKPITYERIGSLGKGTCQLFFDTYRGVRHLVIESSRPTQEQPPLPAPLSQRGDLRPGHLCYSFSRLDDISEVRLCQIGGSIVGMLLEDTKGHRTSLGEIDLDALLPPSRVDKTLGYWATMTYSSGPGPVSDCRGRGYSSGGFQPKNVGSITTAKSLSLLYYNSSDV